MMILLLFKNIFGYLSKMIINIKVKYYSIFRKAVFKTKSKTKNSIVFKINVSFYL